MININKQPKPLFILFVGILAVSSASIFIRFAQQSVPSLVIAAGRLSLATLILLPFCLSDFIKEVLPMPGKTKGMIGLSGIFLALHFAFWISSLEYTSVASSVVLVATTPVWVAILSPAILKERISGWVIAGLTIAVLGSAIVGLGTACSVDSNGFQCAGFHSLIDGKNIVGNLLALGGAFFSCGYLLIGRKVRSVLSIKSYVFSVYGMASLFLVLLVLVTNADFFGFSPANLVWLFALAIIPQLIGHSSFNWALKYLPASFVSIALLGEPIGTVLLAMTFLRESPTFVEIGGGLLILAGILTATRQTQN